MAEVVGRLAALSPQDELAPMQRAVIVSNMHAAEILHGLGVTKSASEATLTVAAEDGTTTDSVVAAIPIGAQQQQE